jgi:acyl-CoA synthetase (AMP-forming)/AMP-acid ligase II
LDLSIQPRTDIVVPGDTIAAMFWNAVAQRGDTVWLRQKELGIWRSWTWTQVGEAVAEIAGGLLSLGLAEGETASILSNTVPEWVLADLAVLSCGGVANGIYPTDAASQVHYLCEDSRTRVLFVEDDEQLDKALEVRERLPLLRGSWCSTWRACATGRPAGHQPGRPARARARPQPAAPGRAEAARGGRSPRTWRSWSTPRAPPASPRAPCTGIRRWSTRRAATTR